MSTKKCAYRGCGSYSNPSRPSPETFYAFPKDPERCMRWLELGACREPIPYTMRYFCSKHFDESKYVACNQRRKQLLSTAVPWPYVHPSPQTEIISEDVDYQCVVSTIDDNEDDDAALERFHDDAVAVEVSNDINISDTIEDALQSFEYHNENSDNDFTITLPPEKKSLKRKLDKHTESATEDVLPGPSNHNIVSNRATSSTILAANENHTKEQEESIVLESVNITTFIFKGQEYIQMPKEEYVDEKIALIRKIKTYEEILKNVKQLVDAVSV